MYITGADKKRGVTDSFAKLEQIKAFCAAEGIYLSPKVGASRVDSSNVIVPFKITRSWLSVCRQ